MKASMVFKALIYLTLGALAAAGLAFAAPAGKGEDLAAALEGRKFLRLRSNGLSGKKTIVAGEFKDFDAVVVDVIDAGDFRRFMTENRKTLLEFCAGEFFGALLIELPAAECKKLDCFVLSGEEDPRDAVRGSVYDTPSFLEFVENVRMMNCETKNARKKIRIKSIYCGLNEEEAYRTLRLVRYADPAAAGGLARLISHLTGDNFNKLNEAQRAEIMRDATDAGAALARAAGRVKAGFSEEEFVKCSLQLDILKSLAECYRKRIEFKKGIDNADALEKTRTGVVIKCVRYYAENDFYNRGIMIFNESLINK